MKTNPVTSGRYAAVTSTLALVVALGGTSYAAATIGTADLKTDAVISSKIKNGTVTGSDVATNTLTGLDIDENKVGRVPRADTAHYAADAGTLTGISIDDVRDTQGTAPGRPHLLYNAGGLQVELGCLGNGNPAVVLTASTTRPAADVATVVVNDIGGGQVHEDDLEDGTFSSGSGPFDLLANDDGDTAQVTFTYAEPGGQVVQGHLFTDIDVSDAEPCKVSGFITARR